MYLPVIVNGAALAAAIVTAKNTNFDTIVGFLYFLVVPRKSESFAGYGYK